MKLTFAALLILSITPFVALAHTSDERYVDGYVIDLSTAPVAPWVGEKVGMSFAFLDPFSGRATTTVVNATLTFDALMRSNKKPPEVVYTSPTFEIKDGAFVTDYVFTEEGTYDLHIAFVDTNGVEHTTGFRKQVRSGATVPAPIGPALFFGALLLVALLGFLSGRLYGRK